MFWRKNDNSNKNSINSDEFERISKRLSEGISRISEIETKVKLLQTDVDNLRGKFNRKLLGIAEEEKVVPKEEDLKKQNYINDNLLALG